MRHALTRALLLTGTAVLTAGPALAGGFDRGAGNIELLFDPSRVATEAGVVVVSPQRDLKNVRREVSNTEAANTLIQSRLPAALPPTAPLRQAITAAVVRPPLSTDTIDVDGDYAVPRLGAKFNIFEPVDCLATYTQPYGADADYGENTAYSATATRFEVDSDEFALTCSYKFDAGRGAFRMIGGVSYQEIEAYLSRQTLLDFGNTGVGEFNLSDEAWSYRIGAAYEIPDIALRASLMYYGKFDYDLEGEVDTTGFGATGTPLVPGLVPLLGPAAPRITTGVFDVDAETEIPQAVEFRLQSGIAANTIAFASVRWQDWSQLQSIPINGVVSPTSGQVSTTTSFDPFYEDGWTVSAGIGRKFSDTLSGLASVTWDKGTSTFQGFQTDTYTVALGGAYTPNEKVELRLGGSVGVLTGGRSDFVLEQDPANYVSYEFDADTVVAGQAVLRVKF